MDAKTYEQITRKAKALAIKWGHRNEAEDFAQEAAIEAFENRLVKFEWTFIGYLRKRFGDTKTAIGRIRSFEERFGLRLDQPANEEGDSNLVHELIGDSFEEPEVESVDIGVRPKNKREELIWIMIQSGVKQKEMGEVLGITESRVSQIMSKLLMKPRLLNAKKRVDQACARAGAIKVRWFEL